MMANSARDPYWQAAVRREVLDHPEAAAEIEDECATCHMPMSRFEERIATGKGQVFAHLPIGERTSRLAELAADGVSCTLCHQITEENFGVRESFNAGFVIDTETAMGSRAAFGPYDVDAGLSTVMHSASGFRQTASVHIQKSELCATCHTVYTEALGPDGTVVGELPEQVPYLEWQHSVYREEATCQSCHMPAVAESTAISSVLGQNRAKVSRHVFQGGNFFMLRMLNRYRQLLSVEALPSELEAAAQRTEKHLQSETARLLIRHTPHVPDTLDVAVHVENLAGHKLPTAYPSRRSWIHFMVRDADQTLLFESGRIEPTGAIQGNANDEDPREYEPHYQEITQPDQVQIYEAMMADADGGVTTGLLSAVRYVKDNRLLPKGFDKATASEDIAVRGLAADDTDFDSGGDTVQYRISVQGRKGPFTVRAVLWYQPISYRWARNLERYDAPETSRFTRLYASMAHVSGIPLASDGTVVPAR